MEKLEERRLFAVTAEVVAAMEGGALVVRGTEGADEIRVYRTEEGIRVGGVEGWFGEVGEVRVLAGGGADSVVISPEVGGRVWVDGGEGDDTLIGYGAGTTLVGGAGSDSFWTTAKGGAVVADADGLEMKRGVNRLPGVFSNEKIGLASSSLAVGSVWDKVSETVSDAGEWVVNTGSELDDSVRGLRAGLKEPKLTGAAWKTADFTGLPLFSESGPSAVDITQGFLNDCYFLASLSTMVRADPSLIRNSIADLGDGTFVVRLMSGKKASYLRIDADLPVMTGSQDRLAYGQLGAEGSLWVALMEKAFALAKGGSYTKLDKGGWMADVYKALGATSKTLASKGSVWGLIDGVLEQGGLATLGTKTKLKDSPLVENHAYAIEGVEYDAAGKPVVVVLRNPVQYASAGGDGVVRVAASVALKAMSAAVVGFAR